MTVNRQVPGCTVDGFDEQRRRLVDGADGRDLAVKGVHWITQSLTEINSLLRDF